MPPGEWKYFTLTEGGELPGQDIVSLSASVVYIPAHTDSLSFFGHISTFSGPSDIFPFTSDPVTPIWSAIISSFHSTEIPHTSPTCSSFSHQPLIYSIYRPRLLFQSFHVFHAFEFQPFVTYLFLFISCYLFCIYWSSWLAFLGFFELPLCFPRDSVSCYIHCLCCNKSLYSTSHSTFGSYIPVTLLHTPAMTDIDARRLDEAGRELEAHHNKKWTAMQHSNLITQNLLSCNTKKQNITTPTTLRTFHKCHWVGYIWSHYIFNHQSFFFRKF